MRTFTVTQREGELLGPIDWAYDFHKHDWSETKGGLNPDVTESRIDLLRQVREGGEASTGGNFYRVIAVGMYDGWPHWEPTPSILLVSPLGGSEWHPWYDLVQVRG